MDAVRYDLSAHYILVADIDFYSSGCQSYVSGAGFEPIGEGSKFYGTFDGNHHAIRGLFISRPTTNAVGLFSALGYGGIVKDLELLDADIEGNYNTGLIAGLNDGNHC